MLTFSKTMHGSGKRMRGFQKTVHGPENTVQRSGEKESHSGEYEGVSQGNEVTFRRKQPPNASRRGAFGKKWQGIGVVQVTIRVSGGEQPPLTFGLCLS